MRVLALLDAIRIFESEGKAGGTQTREHRSPGRMQFACCDGDAGVLQTARRTIWNSLSVLQFVRCHRAALYAARVIVVPVPASLSATSGA